MGIIGDKSIRFNDSKWSNSYQKGSSRAQMIPPLKCKAQQLEFSGISQPINAVDLFEKDIQKDREEKFP